MNILLINHYAGSPLHGMEYRPYYLAREWVRSGHNVTIIAASHSHLRSVQPGTQDQSTEEIIDGIRYIWLSTPTYSGNGLSRVRNMLAFVTRLYSRAAALARSIRPDAVIASSTYPLDIYPARKLARLAGARLIFEVHDLWPLSPMELGGMSPWHPFIMMMQRAENDAYASADKVVSMLPKAFEHMTSHGMAPEKFIYIPNGIDIDEWTSHVESLPHAHLKVLEDLKYKDRFIVGYAGGHGLSNALDTFVACASLVTSKAATLVLVGQGPEKIQLESMATRHGHDNIRFLDPVPKRAIPSLLEQMDVLFLGWKRQPLYRFGISPNKLMDYMMAGKPVIHAVEAGNDLVAESGCGLSIEPENPVAIANAITTLQGMSVAQRKEMGRKGQEFALNFHDYRVLADRFLQAIKIIK